MQSKNHSIEYQQKWNILESLNQQRLQLVQGAGCDVRLVAEDKRFPAHKCVLIGVSTYFESMFKSNSYIESNSEEVELKSISKNSLEVILDSFYTGVLKLDIKNVYEVLAACDHLLLNDIKLHCAHFLEEILKRPAVEEEIIQIWKVVNTFYELSTSLKTFVGKVLSENFKVVINTESFLLLSFEELAELLEDAHLDQPDEMIIWHGIIKWLKYDQINREVYRDEIIAHLRFGLMDSDAIAEIKFSPEMASEKCQALIDKVLSTKYLQEKGQAHKMSHHYFDELKPRFPMEGKTVVFCLSRLGHFLCYIPSHNRWYHLKPPFSASQNTDKTLNSPSTSKVTNSSSKRTVYRDDIKLSESKYSMVFCEGCVYVASSAQLPHEVGHFQLTSIKRYNLTSNQWLDCKLPLGVDNAVLIECNNLYVCSRQLIEVYDASLDKWTQICTMNFAGRDLIISENNKVSFYDVEKGIVQVVELEKRDAREAEEFSIRIHFKIKNACKMSESKVLLSLCNNGETRKIFNTRTNTLKDTNLYYSQFKGLSSKPSPGSNYPHCLKFSDPWKIVCDRSSGVSGCLYILSLKSGYQSIPSTNCEISKDAILPFYKHDLSNKSWTRLPGLPEWLGDLDLKLCIQDGCSSMATCI